MAGDIKYRAGQVMSDVKEAKNVASDIGEKVKTVAEAGRDSVTQRFSN
jgi:hypothetical protein